MERPSIHRYLVLSLLYLDDDIAEATTYAASVDLNRFYGWAAALWTCLETRMIQLS